MYIYIESYWTMKYLNQIGSLLKVPFFIKEVWILSLMLLVNQLLEMFELSTKYFVGHPKNALQLTELSVKISHNFFASSMFKIS